MSVGSLACPSPSLSDEWAELSSELDPSPAIIISPMSAFRGARSSVGTGAGRAGDKVKRSSRLRDLAADLDAMGREEREDVIDVRKCY